MIIMPFGAFSDKQNVGVDDTTTESGYLNLGTKLYGDYCEETKECGFPDSECGKKRQRCECQEHLQVTNHINKCGKSAAINEKCFFNEQCEAVDFRTECRNEICICRIDIYQSAVMSKDGNYDCKRID